MRYKYYYCQLYNPKLVDILEENRIRYKVTSGSLIPTLISFSIRNTSSSTEELIKKITEITIHEPIITVEYTELEIATAELLWITPFKQSVDILNTEEAYLSSCKHIDYVGIMRVHHQQQKGLFAIAREPKPGKNCAFWAESTGFAELFTDFRVYDLVKEHSLIGMDFKNVVLKNGSYSNKLLQLTSKNLLERRCIGTGHGEKIIHCKQCGREQLAINSAYQLHIDFSKIDQKSDLYVTERIFGEGIPYPLYLISQRFYQLLKQANLIGSITVSPVVDINQSNKTGDDSAS